MVRRIDALLRPGVLWTAVALYMALIFWLSAQSNPLPELTLRVSDKVLHGIEYGGLGALLWLALRSSGAGRAAALVLAVTIASLYAATDEFHQAFVPGRNSDPADWLADTVGAAVVALALARWFRVGPAPAPRRD